VTLRFCKSRRQPFSGIVVGDGQNLYAQACGLGNQFVWPQAAI